VRGDHGICIAHPELDLGFSGEMHVPWVPLCHFQPVGRYHEGAGEEVRNPVHERIVPRTDHNRSGLTPAIFRQRVAGFAKRARLDFAPLYCTGGALCERNTKTRTGFNVEPTSKRRHGFPSETQVKRGHRVVGGHKELTEKLGRNDPCPCGSGRRFQEVLYA
jgi:SEC-C motif